jgi:FkbM family methyltransferase
MFRLQPLLRFPKLYAFLALKRRNPNFEKVLYLRQIKWGSTVFDVGANLGYYTLLFSKLTGPKGCVHAFEPVPRTYDKLQKNTQACKNLKLSNFAAGERRTKSEICYDSKDLGKASLCTSPQKSESSNIVEVVPLDDYVEELDLSRLDFVKCDVEGYELHAMRGMEKTLQRFRPQLSLEVSLTLDDKKALLSFLQDIGYDTFRKVEKGFPAYEGSPKNHSSDYFYLHAFSSKVTQNSS